MKIAIDCRMIGSGGIGSYISALLPFFIKNNECLLIGNKENLEKDFFSKNTEIINCDVPTFSVKEILFFPKEITQKINSCDVFYSPYCNIPSGIKIPIFSTIHDVVFLDIPELAGKIGTIARKFFYQYCFNKSKTVFTVSDFSRQRIQHHLKTKKVPVVVTYNALPHWFSINNSEVKKENYILFVGNIKKHKGLYTLLNAFNLALSKSLDAKLLIVGNADNFRTSDETISKEFEKLPEGTFEFTGRISDEKLNELYSKSRVLVQPSLYEGFGMPPLEALNLHTNVILSDIPVFKEIYNNFPVTFFKTEDAEDLCDKLISNWNKFLNTNFSIPDIYSFEKTYKIIIDTIKS